MEVLFNTRKRKRGGSRDEGRKSERSALYLIDCSSLLWGVRRYFLSDASTAVATNDALKRLGANGANGTMSPGNKLELTTKRTRLGDGWSQGRRMGNFPFAGSLKCSKSSRSLSHAFSKDSPSRRQRHLVKSSLRVKEASKERGRYEKKKFRG
ncbi:hypothetical protein BDV23DRAFT_108091 [Aspergillus alliaceus]|uniref:Uncharacterized protein n=1 Tax=Petromyces alliaceus TaxID=209559 RepID=A0A5N7C3T6_PETAA|nr:hypothetical protein BDV23DRAFT_108091 [Aspergillus alliaceus]